MESSDRITQRKKQNKALVLYNILTALFVTSLVTCNLIFQKFFTWNFFGYTFEISVGILAYPVTFIITDLISELYGRKQANQVVITGFFASIFMIFIILVAENVTATSWSRVDNALFSTVFGLSPVAVGASMTAYLVAQFIDIRIFHFWKKLTKGKHLWLRNNASTFTSQFVDTFLVISLLCIYEVDGICENFQTLIINGFLFKVLFALIDTPILYLLTYSARNYFSINASEHINLYPQNTPINDRS